MPAVDALVIGGGPAGAASAIFLAQAGWQVLLVERSAYPRQKVCGECLSAASLSVIDQLGVGEALRSIAGPELSRVGWMDRRTALEAQFPPCAGGAHAYGRAVGRDLLDRLLIERARGLGVEIAQPARVLGLRGAAGAFEAELEWRSGFGGASGPRGAGVARQLRRARTVIDAHGSWEPAAQGLEAQGLEARPPPKRASDLFAFKASFLQSALAPGLLPVISLDGGYGGVVVAEGGRTTLACCLRRDRLRACRAAMPGAGAGAAVERFLQSSCAELQRLLSGARRQGSWLCVGPIRPGIRVPGSPEVFRVGNAAGESHPLVGEGIAMALQGARLLTAELARHRAAARDPQLARKVNCRYAQAWREAFGPRIRFAAMVAHASMHPALHALSGALLRRRPALLTRATRWAGKAKPAMLLTS